MTLDEGIIHAEDVARSNHEAAIYLGDEHPTQAEKCEECARVHEQFVIWLKELKAYRDARTEINQALNDDATNGDVIKAMFPNGKVIERDEATGYEQMIDDKYSYCSWFDGIWWNSPYKAESEEKE